MLGIAVRDQLSIYFDHISQGYKFSGEIKGFRQILPKLVSYSVVSKLDNTNNPATRMDAVCTVVQIADF